MLLYSMLYLTGYGLELDDLKNFRQLGSPTAGHPEYGHAAGIETTTGPLGQGISNAVGLALAERMLAARFNSDGHELVDHYTYTIACDGDLQEGVASEACSLAGHLGLGRLIAFYDDNHISIEGDTELSFSEDVGKRFEAYGWHVAEPGRGPRARPHRGGDRRGEGGRGPALADHRPHAHRAGLAEQAGHRGGARRAARRGGGEAHEGGLGWPSEEPFHVPDEVLAHFRAGRRARQRARRRSGRSASTRGREANPELGSRARARS